MKKALIISGSFRNSIWNNLGRLTRSIANGLVANGHNVTCIHPGLQNQTWTHGNNLHTIAVHIPSKNKTSHLDIGSIPEFNRLVESHIRDSQWDSVWLPNGDGWLAAKSIQNVPIIGWCNWMHRDNNWQAQTPGWADVCEWENDFLANATLVAHSHVVAQNAANVANRNVHVLPCSTSMQHVRVHGAEQVNRKPKSVLFTGRLNRSRELETIVGALRGIAGSSLTICTPDNAGNYGDQLKAMAESNGVFLEILPSLGIDWTQTLCSHEAVVFSGPSEPYAYQLLDALTVGATCLASEASGLGDYLEPENVFKTDELENALRRVFDGNAQGKSHRRKKLLKSSYKMWSDKSGAGNLLNLLG